MSPSPPLFLSPSWSGSPPFPRSRFFPYPNPPPPSFCWAAMCRNIPEPYTPGGTSSSQKEGRPLCITWNLALLVGGGQKQERRQPGTARNEVRSSKTKGSTASPTDNRQRDGGQEQPDEQGKGQRTHAGRTRRLSPLPTAARSDGHKSRIDRRTGHEVGVPQCAPTSTHYRPRAACLHA
eukprot:scaffold1972_cov103-Isochrysis_galbana.AAC.6